MFIVFIDIKKIPICRINASRTVILFSETRQASERISRSGVFLLHLIKSSSIMKANIPLRRDAF